MIPQVTNNFDLFSFALQISVVFQASIRKIRERSLLMLCDMKSNENIAFNEVLTA
jgi:hypothetical protein